MVALRVCAGTLPSVVSVLERNIDDVGKTLDLAQ